MNNTTTKPYVVTAALVSIGGSPAPVLHVLRQHRPAHVWYFCSAVSRNTADEIQKQLDWHPAPRFIEVERFEELGPCYRELRRKIPDILAETHVPPEQVLVDYTGGTKTMSVALALAAIELFQQFSYVGGEQREKGGLGVVIDGKERTLYQSNPWTDLAIREVERARDLWDGYQFEAAAKVLRNVAPRVPCPRKFNAIANLADAMAGRHRLDFSKAIMGILNQLQGHLPLLYDGQDDHGLIEFARKARQLCEACMSEDANDTLLRELLDNAIRTANQARYEDAAARLYRAMEMQGQIWLAAATNRLFVNGKCKKENTDKIPQAIKNLPFCTPDTQGCIKFSMEQVFRALAALGHPHAQRIVADIALGNRSRWRTATQERNSGILAHGVKAIGRDGFDQMKLIATELLGFDLELEANPIPPLNPHWFE